jgi:hypothetical protein
MKTSKGAPSEVGFLGNLHSLDDDHCVAPVECCSLISLRKTTETRGIFTIQRAKDEGETNKGA